MRTSTWIAILLLGTLLLLGAAAAFLPDLPTAARLREEMGAIEVPPGGVVVSDHVSAPPLLSWQGDFARRLLHYPEADVSGLANETAALLARAGWSLLPYSDVAAGELYAERADGWELRARIGRWEETGGGCCVETDDPGRPVALNLHLSERSRP